ncbi:predicted protein [Uncinocarpus reesii 1704]|uniref:AtmA protein n=1 Tax=Uncinocarpus reesii (strain UAMH 1704) TaxID=336963 RepID=C4JH32_UNCRE|nr:uncharacterized protein UREG_01283 [Uncinocarpus reesii 1704]EEP76434.1 predicted protein [Uncinocarpus reesii 1704]
MPSVGTPGIKGHSLQKSKLPMKSNPQAVDCRGVVTFVEICKMVSQLKYFIPLCSVWGAISVFYFSYQNGHIPAVQDMAVSKLLPGGELLNTNWTGVTVIDEILTAFVPFFYPIVNGTSPNLSLYAAKFAGAVAAIYILVCLESVRAGNQGRLIAYFAVSAPLYVTLHLFTSPTASKPTKENINMPVIQVKTLLWSTLAGYVVPSVLVAFPEMAQGLLPSKQHGIALWQAWPIYVAIFQYGISKSAEICCPSGSGNVAQNRSSLRYLYAFAFACAAIPHIASWAISLSALAFPTLFSPELASTLTPRNVFENISPWSSQKPETLGMGTLWLLQWDYMTAAAPTLLWAILLYNAAHSACGIRVSSVKLGFKTIALCAVAGIAGAAVELMWERDELLFGSSDAQKGQRGKE